MARSQGKQIFLGDFSHNRRVAVLQGRHFKTSPALQCRNLDSCSPIIAPRTTTELHSNGASGD